MRPSNCTAIAENSAVKTATRLAKMQLQMLQKPDSSGFTKLDQQKANLTARRMVW
jgi:hypothetical protein